jgi:hypothetical protein
VLLWAAQIVFGTKQDFRKVDTGFRIKILQKQKHLSRYTKRTRKPEFSVRISLFLPSPYPKTGAHFSGRWSIFVGEAAKFCLARSFEAFIGG